MSDSPGINDVLIHFIKICASFGTTVDFDFENNDYV
jgi:hypothetical protein